MELGRFWFTSIIVWMQTDNDFLALTEGATEILDLEVD